MLPPNFHDALIYLMVSTSAVDRIMTDDELSRIGALVKSLPVFAGFNTNSLPHVAAKCAEILDGENGMDIILGVIKSSVPTEFRDTAYALAVEIAVADSHLEPEEIRFLQIVRKALEINSITAAAIELSARARHREL